MKKLLITSLLMVAGVAHAERWAQTNVDSLLGKTITNYVDLDSFKMINGFGYYKTKTTITDNSSGESSTKISSLEMECKTTAFRVIGTDTWWVSNNRNSFIYQMTCRK